MDKKGLSKPWIIAIVVVVVFLLIIGWLVGTYNGFVSSNEVIDGEWANVQSQYQRRADLIPNLISTVEGAVAFEKDTQTQIVALRTRAVSARQAVSTATTPSQLATAGAQVDDVVSSFGGLNINVENYPQLGATENFLSLQDELAGTENRIQVSRERFNTAVRNYNVRVKRFPANMVASWFNFESREFFEADAGTEVAPTVSFD